MIRNSNGTVTLTVPLADLTNAITWTSPAASTDERLDSICFTYGPAAKHAAHYTPSGARKPFTGYALSLAATDRYRLHWSTTTVPDGPTETDALAGSFCVKAKALVAAAKSWPKPPRGEAPGIRFVRITFTPDLADEVRLEAMVGDQVIALNVLPSEASTFPKYESLVPKMSNDTGPSIAAFAPAFLMDLAKASKALFKDSCLVFHFQEDATAKKAALVFPNNFSEQAACSAILMPVKVNR